MSGVRWLHLSDFHFSGAMAHDPYDAEQVLRPLIRLLTARRSAEGELDLLFITGDLGSHGRPGDYEVAEKYLGELIRASGVKKDHVWIVPGNHDVERDQGKSLLRTLSAEQDASGWFFASPGARSNHLSKFTGYLDFMRSYFPGRVMAPGDVVHEPGVHRFGKLTLGVLPLNSAWFAQGDDDRGQLWIGARLVRERAEFLRQRGAEIVVALCHHPLSDLHEDESAGAWIRNQCDVLLRGHLHSANAESIASDAGAVLEIAAGATYQGSAWPCRAFYGTVNGSTRSITLEPIRYVSGPAAPTWALDVEAFPGRHRTGYQALFTLPSYSVPAQAEQSATFPYREWTAVSRADWLNVIVDWFSLSYASNPDFAMRELVHHVSGILRHSADQPNLGARVANLGRALIPHLPEPSGSGEAELSHHLTVLELLAFGLTRELSHLFMLPRVDLEAILQVPDYSRLLLATRELGAGEYRRASALAAEIGPGCCVALYVMAQCDRKMELNYEAQSKFDSLDRLVRRIDASGQPTYPCSASKSLECLCNRDLLRASLARARGVVARRLGKTAAAEKHFATATVAARRAVRSLRADRQKQSPGTLVSAYDRSPFEVLADVHYSHAYYWYGVGNLAKARQLFKLSIDALAETGASDSWDSPYTRLAIVYLAEGDSESAIEYALRARNICKATPGSSNREAPLSLALNTLTIRVLEPLSGRQLITSDADPLLELEVALAMQPSLALGPLGCHRKDALLILAQCRNDPPRAMVQDFADRLRQAERETYPGLPAASMGGTPS